MIIYHPTRGWLEIREKVEVRGEEGQTAVVPGLKLYSRKEFYFTPLEERCEFRMGGPANSGPGKKH